MFECRRWSFTFDNNNNNKIKLWKSTGLENLSRDLDMDAVGESGRDLPDIKNDGRLYVYLSANHFKQNKVIIPNNNNVINIYCVYELQPTAFSRDNSYTVQNALLRAMQITKNPTNNSKNNYKGYGICFDERSNFSHTTTQDGRQGTSNGKNVLMFGADMSFSIHATNRANHISCFGEGLTQGINNTTIYAEKNYWRNFTEHGEKLTVMIVICLLTVGKS